ncbi:GIY-YIG nuclease family protein [Streptomyces venezuelae]
MSKQTALYRLFDENDRLLYLGIARDPESRWKLHSDRQTWWHLVARKTVEWYADRDAAKAAEKQLTAREMPLFDKANKKAAEAVEYDDSKERARVVAWVLDQVSVSQPNWEIGVGSAARACGTSRTSARHAMYTLTREGGPLRGGTQGRFIVADKTPGRRSAA